MSRLKRPYENRDCNFSIHSWSWLGGEKMKVIEDYGRAIENSDEYLFKHVFAPQVCVEIPAGTIFDQPANAAAYQLSQVARTAPGIKLYLRGCCSEYLAPSALW